MRSHCLRLCIVLAVFLFSIIPARAANNVLNPLHCDFNKDGKADVLWSTSIYGAPWLELSVWYMDGITAPASIVLSQLQNMPVSLVACGDFLGNGNTDIIWSADHGMATVWLMDGITPTRMCVSYSPPSQYDWHVFTVADMDGLGPLDILWSNYSTGQYAITYTSGCGSTSGYVLLPAERAWNLIATGDFNGDGHADLLWCCGANHQYSIWLMNNTTILSSATFNPGWNWHVSQVADFDGDGKSDILWQNFTTGEVSTWFMDGTSIKSNASLPSVTPGWLAVGADDYDGNGHVDILWQNSNTGEFAVWLMNGSQLLQSGDIATRNGWTENWKMLPSTYCCQ